MLIAPVDPGRAAEVVALWEAAGLTRPWNDPHADLERALRGPSSTVLAGVEETDRLIATAMVGHDGHRGWVLAFYETLGYEPSDVVVMARRLDRA